MRYQGKIPTRIAKLPVDVRGYPVPWFVQWFDGKPDFRVMDSRKMARAVKDRRCWVCGDKFGHLEIMCFVIGPMCGVNRVSAEPPSHRECAEFSVKACPFLTLPRAQRREAAFPDAPLQETGVMLSRNPGVSLLWLTDYYETFRAPVMKSAHGNGGEPLSPGIMFTLGDPVECIWYREGRPATRAECVESVDSGMPILRDAADGGAALASLEYWHDELARLMPA